MISKYNGLNKRRKSKNVANYTHFLTNESVNTFNGLHIPARYFIFSCLEVIVI
jgi:hypothetical protein